MIGIKTIYRIENIKRLLDDMGLEIRTPKYYREKDVMALVPKDQNSLPVFSRDAEVFVGNLDEVETWLIGVQWARNYDTMVFGKSHSKNREKKEDKVRHNMLVDILKQDDVKVDK